MGVGWGREKLESRDARGSKESPCGLILPHPTVKVSGFCLAFPDWTSADRVEGLCVIPFWFPHAYQAHKLIAHVQLGEKGM